MEQGKDYNRFDEDFFEEVDTDHSRYNHYEMIDSDQTNGNEYGSGLSQDSVHKLTEDLLNPLPPSDEDSPE